MKQTSSRVSAIVVGIFMNLFSAFVAMNYWNWFIVNVLNVYEITFVQMLGAVLFIGLFKYSYDSNDHKWKKLFSIIEYCIPKENIEAAEEKVQDLNDNILQDAFIAAFGQFIGLSVSLLLGFILYNLS